MVTMSDLATLELGAKVEALQGTVAALEKQIGRAGREQLKANAIAERQAEQLAEALTALHAAEERRAAELEAAHAQRRTAVAEARLEVARAIFPSIDGLDEALRAGRAMLEHAARRETANDLLQRLLFDEPTQATHALVTTLDPWLQGLTMVRRRLLDALSNEGIASIDAEGQSFDPRLHIAVEAVVTDAPPGTVIHVLRRGFVVGERVLRPVEVAVAAAPSAKSVAL
ncbi:MAG: nucleotide exchange factor GrpE [Candidatus Viridilinea halotolerans]|uniref:Protein GrpE n=1 Tax=Candidatus Viridilinea halotolerans TaxID=2491704 RepID=A0A426TYT0_9CHLR|nr:MAG: nucleotide exchange factor GrpE [Candidatus Viridilinea halotolerans]